MLKSKFISAQWIFGGLLLLFFCFLHIKSGYVFSKDVSYFFFFGEQWFVDWDYTRFVAHILNAIPVASVSMFTSNPRWLAYSMAAGPWISFFATWFLTRYFLLKRESSHLAFLIPLFWCATITKGLLFSEFLFTLALLVPALVLLISEDQISMRNEIILGLLFALAGITHQSSFLCAGIFLLYFIARMIQKKKLMGPELRLSLILVLTMIFNIYFSLFPDPPVCRACRDDFANTFMSFQHHPSNFFFLIFSFGVLAFCRLNRWILGIASILLLSIMVKYSFSHPFTNMSFHWNNRVFALISFCAFSFYLLFFSFFKGYKERLFRLYSYGAIFCIFSLLLSFPYVIEWTKFTDEFYIELSQSNSEKSIASWETSQAFKLLNRHNHKFFEHSESLQQLSILVPLLRGDIVTKKIFYVNTAKIFEQESFFKSLLSLKKFNLTFSDDLKSCLEEINTLNSIESANCVQH